MTIQDALRADTRLGFHYFSDSLHYREVDLYAWMPEIKALGGSWLTLIAPNDRAIPEAFLRGLMREYIEPIIHFRLPVDHPTDLDSLGLLLHAYADWGVRYVALYDRPNLRANWSPSAWVRSDLVERFLDVFIPAANLVQQVGLVPIFPPLEPGGDYWDTAFLRGALQGILHRGQNQLAENLILGAYAWVNKHALNWGAGGPEHWPQARPYHTPEGQEDQRGFYIFDWYLAIAEAVLSASRPVILLGAGYNPASRVKRTVKLDLELHAQINQSIRMVMQDSTPVGAQPEGGLFPVSAQVLACNYWLLAADAAAPERYLAWFQANGSTLPVVEAFKNKDELKNSSAAMQAISPSMRPIAHYLLLAPSGAPLQETLSGLMPWISENRPTIGFSIEEAALAARVTIHDAAEMFSEELIDSLRSAGCTVQHLDGIGTSIAPSTASNQPLPM